MKQESSSFFEKKEPKKLFRSASRGVENARGPKSKSFLVTFFQKSNCFLSFKGL